MKFKDYEYGWYGLSCSYKALWFNNAYCYDYELYDGRKKSLNKYKQSHNQTKVQIQKLKGVIFIYGDYKTCI